MYSESLVLLNNIKYYNIWKNLDYIKKFLH